MNHYRSHNISEFRACNLGEIVIITVWVLRKRDLGGLLIIAQGSVIAPFIYSVF